MFFGGIGKIKNILYIAIIIVTVFLFWNTARTETESGNINVNMSVPVLNHCNNGTQDGDETGVDCGGATCSSCGGGVVTYDNPIIYFVGKNEYINSVKIIWEVNVFGHGLDATDIFYSEGVDFASTTGVTVSGTQFVAEILNLKSNTTYNFKITAKDNNSVEAVPYQSQFKTVEANVLNSMTILAKPEKRITKTGGNFGATANLLFYDSIANSIVFSTSTILDSSGTTVLNNVEIPETANISVILKTNAHLAKRINGVNTETTDLTLDFTNNNTFYLLAGDMAGDLQSTASQNPFDSFLRNNRRDEFIDILDISAIVSKFNNQNSTEPANLNKDNIVDAQDISIVLSNWNKTGDMIEK